MSETRRRPSGGGLRRLWRALLWAVAALLVAGLGVPLIHANRFRQQIAAALEGSLGRRVEIGEVTLNLLTGPGFQLHNVVIGEDPAFGIEHFAYMTSMQARIRLRTLWTGQLQLASLTLSEPSINLAKNAQGRWNLESLFQQSRTSGRKSGGPVAGYFPYIGIEDGRLNFKFAEMKSVFHFEEVEAALAPARDPEGRWRIRFAGRPARTDRIMSGMGRLTGEGELTTAGRRVRLELALEKSPLEHLLTLVYGRDFGLHGDLGARVGLSGVVPAVQVRGTLEAGDMHRWDLLPSEASRLAMPFAGELDLAGQQLRLETDSSGAAPRAVQVHFEMKNYLSAPEWKAAVELEQAPAEPFLRTARHLGAPLPAGVELRGALNGRLDFPGSLWPTGSVQLDEGQLLVRGAPILAVGAAEAALDGPAFQLSPVKVRMGREVLQVSASGRLDQLRWEGQVAAPGIRLEEIRRQLQALKPGWLHALKSGSWDGRAVYRKEPGRPGVWSGSGLLTSASWQPEGLEAPIEVAQAKVRWESQDVHLDGLSGAAGRTRFTGSCRHRPAEGAAARSEDTCRLRIAELDLAELDRWINPRQERSRWEIWRRVLGRTTPEMSSWLKSARIRGAAAVGSLRLGNWALHNVRSEVFWSGDTLLLEGLRAEWGRGVVSGALRAQFSGAEPQYRLEAAVRGIDLKGLSASTGLPANFQRGTLDLKLALSASGRTAADLRAGLEANGAFVARSIVLDNVEWSAAAGDSEEGRVEIRSLEGRFELARSGLELNGLRMLVGKDVYQGRGSIGGSPPVLLDVATRGQQSRLVGMAALEQATTKAP